MLVPAPEAEGGAGAAPRLLPVVWVSRCETRLGNWKATGPAGTKRGAGLPRPARGVLLLPPGGLQAQQLSDTRFKARGKWAGSGSICTIDYSRLKVNTFFECLMGDSVVLGT